MEETFSDSMSIPESIGITKQYSEDWSVSTASFKGYSPRSSAPSPIDVLRKESKSILCKINISNYEKLSVKLKNLEMSTDDDIKIIIEKFIENIKHSAYIEIIGKLCIDIINDPEWKNTMFQTDNGTKSKANIFKTCLITKLQEEFTRDWMSEINAIALMDIDPNDVTDQQTRLRQHRAGIFKFIGEMFKHKLIPLEVFKGIILKLFKCRLNVEFEINDDNTVTFIGFDQVSDNQQKFIDAMIDNQVTNFEELRKHPKFQEFLPNVADVLDAYMIIKDCGIKMSDVIRASPSSNSKVRSVMPTIFKYVHFFMNNFEESVHYGSINLIEYRQIGIREGHENPSENSGIRYFWV